MVGLSFSPNPSANLVSVGRGGDSMKESVYVLFSD